MIDGGAVKVYLAHPRQPAVTARITTKAKGRHDLRVRESDQTMTSSPRQTGRISAAGPKPISA